jgi:hypothetical protein
VGEPEVEDDGGADERRRTWSVLRVPFERGVRRQSVSADITVTTFDPPRAFSIRSDQHQDGKKDAWYENDYRLLAQGNGTLVTKKVTGSLSPVVFALAHFAIKKDAMTSLGNLKRRIESSSGAGGTV